MRVPSTSNPSGNDVSIAMLLARAEGHRAVATSVHPVLAGAYLRRAAELRLAAWLRAARSAPLDIDEVLSTVAA